MVENVPEGGRIPRYLILGMNVPREKKALKRGFKSFLEQYFEKHLDNSEIITTLHLKTNILL